MVSEWIVYEMIMPSVVISVTGMYRICIFNVAIL